MPVKENGGGQAPSVDFAPRDETLLLAQTGTAQGVGHGARGSGGTAAPAPTVTVAAPIVTASVAATVAPATVTASTTLAPVATLGGLVVQTHGQ